MKICDVYVDGFGALHNRKFSLTPGLTIIKGANEAGKTTLLFFLRRMLFGFSSRGKRDFNSYPPLNGGQHGGYLNIVTQNGDRYTLERYSSERDAKIRCLDATKTEATMANVLGTADRELFENVFAFGLTELQSFDTLSAQSIQDRLASASIGVTKTEIPELKRLLTDKINAYYYKGAKTKPEIIRKFHQIADLEKDLKSLSRSQSKYDNLFSQRDRKESRLAKLKAEKQRIETEKLLNDAALRAWEDWANYKYSTEELESFQATDSFPEKGIEQLLNIEDKIAELDELRAKSSRDYTATDQVLNNIVFEERVPANKDTIREIELSFKKYSADKSALHEIEGNISSQTQDLNAKLRTIGKDWTIDRVLSLDLSASSKVKLKEFQDTFAQQQQELPLIRQQLNQRIQKKNSLSREIDSLTSAISFHEQGSFDNIQNIEQALERLTARLSDLYQKRTDLNSRKKDEAENAAALELRGPTAEFQISTRPAAITAVFGIVCLIFGLVVDEPLIALLSFILLIAAAFTFRKATKTAAAPPGTASDSNVSLSELDVLNLSDLRKHAESELESLENDMLKDAKICGFDKLPDSPELSIKSRQLAAIKAELAEKASLYNRKRDQEELLQSAEDDVSQGAEALEAAEVAEASLTKDWSTWLSKVGFDHSLSPRAVSTAFNTAEQCMSIHQNLEKMETGRNSLRSQVFSYEGQVLTLMEALGEAPLSMCEGNVQKAIEALSLNELKQTRFNELGTTRKTLSADVEAFSQRIQHFEQQKLALFRQANAANEGEFRQNGASWARKKELETLQSDSQLQLKKASETSGKSYTQFLNHLAHSDYGELARKRESHQELITSVESEIGNLQTELGESRKSLTDLESDDKAAFKKMEYARILDDLHEDSRMWAKLTLAQFLLRKGIEEYEQERQPAVYREAQEHFDHITNGKYVRILKPIDADDTIVMNKAGARTSTNTLSTATAEQLYLSLRFGYVTEFCKHSEPLPVIFDDIIVNFDPQRQQNACEAIARLADTTQVLYFTCHPETVAYLLEKEQAATVVDL